ncbi:hypothetical protein HNQ91_000788 [Filimonas zeae]|uniref:Uncharacterized protein n=1 Tax=Filimonas zeae TaxID=1737353 RepID=A0A917IPS3_9BACT|nr:hypothetical protein [Filimonas zeae]MDR6337766.1 hypothetical protein [Filimonas zeae]GGH60161.1 hypothetical protein GCM10011379_07710 [Filimonas zeae]
MKKQHVHFVPRSHAERGPWAGNVKEKIAVIGPMLGLDAVWVTRVETAAGNIQNKVDTVEVRKRDLESAVAAKNQSMEEDLMVILNAAGIMKRHPDYREQLGSDLGIVGYTVQFDEKDLKPTLKLRAFEGKVEVSFNLQLMNSITIYSRIKGTLGWEKIGNDKASPFIDTRPLVLANQPEIREYRGCYFDGKEDVGQMSSIETIVFAG